MRKELIALIAPLLEWMLRPALFNRAVLFILALLVWVYVGASIVLTVKTTLI